MLGAQGYKIINMEKGLSDYCLQYFSNSEQTELNITIVFTYSPLNTSNDQIMTLCAVSQLFYKYLLLTKFEVRTLS